MRNYKKGKDICVRCGRFKKIGRGSYGEICPRCYQRDHSKMIRVKVLEFYGGKCKCCGESRYEFLAFDHINGGGQKHRRERNISNLQDWLHANKYPKGFRVLCHNCNLALGFYKYCPHKYEKTT